MGAGGARGVNVVVGQDERVRQQLDDLTSGGGGRRAGAGSGCVDCRACWCRKEQCRVPRMTMFFGVPCCIDSSCLRMVLTEKSVSSRSAWPPLPPPKTPFSIDVPCLSLPSPRGSSASALQRTAAKPDRARGSSARRRSACASASPALAPAAAPAAGKHRGGDASHAVASGSASSSGAPTFITRRAAAQARPNER